MKMVNRLISITEGDITIDGTSVRSLDLTDLRRGIGYVIQQVGLFPHLSVGDNIGTVPKLLGWPKKRIRARAEELLELVGLEARRCEALPGPALGRPATARRPRARARGEPAADADGRAVRRDRPDHPRAASGRVPAPAPRVPQDGDLRHARHRRGDQDGRPHRDPPRGRDPRAVRHAGRDPREPGDDVRRESSSARTAASSGCRCAASATSSSSPRATRRADAPRCRRRRRCATRSRSCSPRARTRSSSSTTTASRPGCSRCDASATCCTSR